MLRCCLYLLIICLLPAYALGNELLDYLKAYEGRWVGQFSIHSTANGYTESFPVEQRYWWDGDVLYGLAVSQRDSGLAVASSKTWLDGKKLMTEIKQGDSKESFYGVLHDGALLWLPTDMQRANDYQMREFIVPKDGKTKMAVEGFDTYVYVDGLAHIIIKGELTLQSDSEEGPP
ncbi:hypothetical protein [Coraliomargarita sinensis]|uniref:hypothetical protein n=1 Tax=Coraliomargarita sinensis TaxID=2174842 RepID=UPI0011B5EEB1|nr:hypothetical protein [Coraliomargarita sinensis]